MKGFVPFHARTAEQPKISLRRVHARSDFAHEAKNIIKGLSFVYLAILFVAELGDGCLILPAADGPAQAWPECRPYTDPLQVQVAQAFAVELAAGRVPSVRAIRAGRYVGQPRAQRVRAHLVAHRGAGGRVPRTSGCDL